MAGSSGKPTQFVVPTGTTQTSVTVHFPSPPPNGVDETYVGVDDVRLKLFEKAFDNASVYVDTTGANGSNGGTVTVHK